MTNKIMFNNKSIKTLMFSGKKIVKVYLGSKEIYKEVSNGIENEGGI